MVGDADGVKAGIASLSCSACAVLAAGTASARNSDCDGPAPADCSSEGEPASRLPVILSKNPMLLIRKLRVLLCALGPSFTHHLRSSKADGGGS